jgi:hypothetical protein
MNPSIFTAALVPLTYILWIVYRPLQAVAFAAELKRRYRRWIVRRHGEEAFNALEKQMRAKAGNNARRQKAVDILMAQERERIIEKFGTDYANWSLGTPSPLERDF